jgi:hypothetical protein
MAALGGALLLNGRHVPDADPTLTAAFRLCVGSLLAILVTGGFGYSVCEALAPGFFYAPNGGLKNAWLLPQAFLIVVYLMGAALAFLSQPQWRIKVGNPKLHLLLSRTN